MEKKLKYYTRPCKYVLFKFWSLLKKNLVFHPRKIFYLLKISLAQFSDDLADFHPNWHMMIVSTRPHGISLFFKYL